MFHLYQQGHQLNYQYTDRMVRQYINMGGALFNVYKWEKIKKSDGSTVDITEFPASNPIFNENAGRIYSKVAYDLYGVTTMNTPQFSFTFTGISSLDTDEKEISFHYNSMIEQLGRKIIIGDVIEWTWLRDLDVLGNDYRGFNKFMVVTDSARDEKGWAANYTYHLWKIKCKPLTLTQEYYDLINNGNGERPGSGHGLRGGEGLYNGNNLPAPGAGNGDVIGSDDAQNKTNQGDIGNEIMDTLLDLAEQDVSFKRYNQHHVYIDEDTENMIQPYVIYGDGIPDNMNAEDIDYGDYFPANPKDGEFFLRIDYNPPRLFQRTGNGWEVKEFDNRKKWTGTPEILRNIINQNNKQINSLGEEFNMRQNIKDLVKARVKKEHNRPLDWKNIGVTKP